MSARGNGPTGNPVDRLIAQNSVCAHGALPVEERKQFVLLEVGRHETQYMRLTAHSKSY